MALAGRLALVGIVALIVALPTSTVAFSPPTPWDGVNPFKCTLQNAGLGTAVPDPRADPYCVQFDKTHQNLDQLGIADFLMKEPARTAAAVNKCFYYQQDHWRGSLVQSDAKTVAYEFYGHYFFNKATGDGGAWVTGFTVAGQTFDPTTLPGFPPGYGKYFGPGTGGVITHDEIPADPSCVALAATTGGSLYSGQAGAARCLSAAGEIGRRSLGPVSLGETEDRIRAALGAPATVRRGYLRYCVGGGGELLAGQAGDRSGTLGASGSDPTTIVLTTSRGFGLHGRGGRVIVTGSSRAGLHSAYPHARRLLRLRGGTDVYGTGRGSAIAAIRAGRVRYLGLYDARAIRTARALARYLVRAA